MLEVPYFTTHIIAQFQRYTEHLPIRARHGIDQHQPKRGHFSNTPLTAIKYWSFRATGTGPNLVSPPAPSLVYFLFLSGAYLIKSPAVQRSALHIASSVSREISRTSLCRYLPNTLG